MEVDIRLPIGFMFSILGLILLIFGLLTYGDPMLYQRSLDINVNIWSGLMMLIFGGFMLLMSFMGRHTVKK